MVALHTAIAIVLVIAMIIRFKIDPVISLMVASLYLGLASDVGFNNTLVAITSGFGDIMAKVGLLIGFGVLIAGIIAPMLADLNTAPLAVGFAIASGSILALQVNSNFFWMFKALLGLSTQGALKTLTVVTSLASVVSLPLVIVLALVL